MEADRCSLVAAQLVSVRPRTRHKSADHLISKGELDDFVLQVKQLVCRIDCAGLLKLQDSINTLESSALEAISSESSDVSMLSKLLEDACAATIEIKCLAELETVSCHSCLYLGMMFFTSSQLPMIG